MRITYRCTKKAAVLYEGEELGEELHVQVDGEAANGSVATLTCHTPRAVQIPVVRCLQIHSGLARTYTSRRCHIPVCLLTPSTASPSMCSRSSIIQHGHLCLNLGRVVFVLQLMVGQFLQMIIQRVGRNASYLRPRTITKRQRPISTWRLTTTQRTIDRRTT